MQVGIRRRIEEPFPERGGDVVLLGCLCHARRCLETFLAA